MKEEKSGSLKEGLSNKEKIKQDMPRQDGQGQRPVCPSESVSTDRGKFTIK